MANDDLHVLEPEPIDHERRPLLDPSDPGHGTITVQEQHNLDTHSDDHGRRPEYTSSQIWLMLMAPLLGLFFMCAEAFVVATLAGPITADLDAQTSFSWMVSSYFVAQAVTQSVSGRLSDILGRRLHFNAACFLFVIGLLMCGLAPSIAVLAAGRAVCGLGGGAFAVACSAVTSDVVPLSSRGLWQGYSNIFLGVAYALGSTMGGLLGHSLGWRMVFLIQVPFILLLPVIAYFTIRLPCRDPEKSDLAHIDWFGCLSVAVGLTLLLLALDSGGKRTAWTSLWIVTAIPAAFVCLALFVFIELRVAKEPIIPITLLADRTAIACCFFFFLNNAYYTILLFYIPVWLQVIRNQTTAEVGLRVLLIAAGWAVGSISCGALMSYTGKYYWQTFAAQLVKLLTTTAVAVYLVDENTPAWPIWPVMFTLGWAGSACTTNVLPGFFAATGHENQAVMASAMYVIRTVGSTLGIAVASAVFQHELGTRLWDRFGDYPDAARRIDDIRNDLSLIDSLGPKWHRAVMDIFVEAIRRVWLLTVIVTGAALVAGLFMRELKLKRTLG